MITLVPMTPADFERFLAHQIDLYTQDLIKAGDTPEDAAERASSDLNRSLSDGLDTPDNHLYNIHADDIAEPVGWLWFADNAAFDPPVFINDIEIFPAYQRRGYGEQALREVENIAAKRGLSRIGLHVQAHNHDAKRLYEKVGYTPTGHLMSKRVLPVDEALVRRAIQLSADAAAKGNEPFGALIAKDGQIILEAENTVSTAQNVTNHAETNLVRMAVQKYDEAFLSGCVLYTSTEPCAMCSGAIYWSGIGAVVFACSEKRLSDYSGLALSVPCRNILHSGTHEILVQGPILEDEAAAIHAGYWKPKP
jgi:tRNA(Arg) A34 adenosine deaminase TadA/GNAT superfamily N-acetyltransferase